MKTSNFSKKRRINAKNSTVLFANKTKLKKPAIPWNEIKNRILGDKYELSIVFVGDGIIKKLNKCYNKITNVLSFSLSKDTGEIFINLSYIKKEAKRSKIIFLKYLKYLYIHSLLHLKGFKHGRKMEKEEKKIISR
jgi:rRNA maturation RNase YbeY